MSYPAVHLIPLAAGLLVAAIWDISARRIPNAICAAVAIAGLGLQFWDGGPLAALAGLGAGAATIALLFAFWQRGGIGGGDVKLAGAVAVCMGPWSLPAYWLAAASAGGVVAGICMLASPRAARAEMRSNLAVAALHQVMPDVRLASKDRVSVPYGVAIVLGAAFVWWRGL